jgi:type IV pilus secretin PilQ/predicted competence protein
MIANSEQTTPGTGRPHAHGTIALLTVVAIAAAAGIMVNAAAPGRTGIEAPAAGSPVENEARLVGVTVQDNAVLIESTEPAAYSVSRPDAMTLTVDMRNVSVADARNEVTKQGAIAGVRLEQAKAVAGRALARVHVALAGPVEYSIKSARNTIRLELKPGAATTPRLVPTTPTAVRTPAATPKIPAPVAQPPAARTSATQAPIAETKTNATLLERIRTSKTAGATTITLSGNGRLEPAAVVESKDRPRRLVIDFPEVTSKTPTVTAIDSPLVSRVRVGVNSAQPLVTRVVMDIAPATTYHVERSGNAGRDLDVIFETTAPASAVAAEPIVLAAAAPIAPPVEPEAPVTLEQATANVAAITKPAPAEPITALNTTNRGRETAAIAGERAPSAPSTAAPPRTPAAAPASTPRVTASPSTRQAAPAPQAPGPLQVRSQAAAAQQPAAQTPPQAPPAQTPAQPQTPVPGAMSQAPQPAGSRQFTGHPISLDFEGADLRAVLRSFVDVSGLNMVIDPDVQGTVDIILADVPWDQALDVILKGNQLDYTVDGTIVRISKIKTLEEENKARVAAAQAAAERQAQAGGLTFETIPLSYAKADAIAPLLRGSLRLSRYGQVQYDVRTNTMIIADLPEQLPAIRELIRSLDRAEPQVEVEARIVQTTRDFARAIGVQWGLNGRVMPDLGNTTGLAFPNRGTLGGRLGSQGPTDPRVGDLESTATAVRMGVPDASTAIGVALGAVNGAFNLDIALSALERTGKGRVLSTPRLTTQNNIEAEVAQGIQIPIQVVANNTVTVNFKDAVLVLRVTPQITAANTVIMKITIENATADFSRQVNGIPPVDTQRANTQVQIDDGATTVIGGIFISQEQTSNEKTPLLHRIPILGWLFKNERLEDESRELLIFITPRILKG